MANSAYTPSYPNLTGAITSLGNATSLGSFTLAQLDALFKAGLMPDDIAAQIQAVKDKYPKVSA